MDLSRPRLGAAIDDASGSVELWRVEQGPMQAWAAEATASGLVLALVPALLALAARVAEAALAEAWPWAVALGAFLVLRALVAGLHAAMRVLVERAFSPEASSPSRP